MLEIIEGAPDRDTFDRLFDEAREKIAAERLRVGDRALRESLWASLNTHTAYTYILDGYVVGCGSHQDLQIGEEKWLWYTYPTLGCDASGSRAWFYTEDFQRVGAAKRRQQGYAGMIVVANSQSPAKAAVESVWGSYAGHWDTPVVVTADSVFGERSTDALRNATVFKIKLAG
tara:strand:+ start:8233 stop:8751 length:519 start_codon:yes stop_codon:yes gene_type:complete